ncbi:hypothetical protein [Massilia sp. DWR3-1-1]|uniref:hypothetical protein n=1 Tax=Massilia sp. DWR3-1-1 TaxID=2804559 RepID=UPI003CF30526
MKVDRLLDLAFFPGRAPRSAEYHDGCAAALEYRILGTPIHCRHQAGSSAADAWHAGVEEGHNIWRAGAAPPAGEATPPERALLRSWRAMRDTSREFISDLAAAEAAARPRRAAPTLNLVRGIVAK